MGSWLLCMYDVCMIFDTGPCLQEGSLGNRSYANHVLKIAAELLKCPWNQPVQVPLEKYLEIKATVRTF